MKRFLTRLNLRIIIAALCLITSILFISCNRGVEPSGSTEPSSQTQPSEKPSDTPTEDNSEMPTETPTKTPTETPTENNSENPITPPCEHEYDNSCDAICNICSHVRTVEHVFMDAWQPGSNSHWKRCEVCGFKYEEAEHVYSNACDSDCNVCGEIRIPAEHIFGNYVSNSESHMVECSVCGYTKNIQSHTYEACYIDENAHSISCVVCEYIKENTSHIFSNGYCACGYANPCVHEGGQATCTSLAVCIKCGYEYGNLSPHTPTVVLGYTATCTENGLSDGSVCSVCDTILVAQEMIPAAHTPVIIPAKAPTCTETGLSSGEACSACGEILLEQSVIEAIDHDYSQTNYTAPTCTKNGITVYTCSICSHSYDVTSVPMGHSESDWIVNEAECETDGIRSKVCLVCGETVETQVIPATGHNWSAGEPVPPTCESGGYTTYTCLSCTKTEQRDLTDATGHTPIIDEAKAPTCTEDGRSEGRHCFVCDKVLTPGAVIPATGHDYQYSACKNCGDMISHETVAKQSMPRLDINTNGAGIDSKEIYTASTVTLSDCDEEFMFSNISAGIRLRGNSTMYAAKRPYRLKFDVKQNILGLNNGKKFKSWVLLADYFDSTMLRTYSTFSMADILLENRYFSSDCTPVEVYINGAYQGVYLLCEQSQIDGNRVDIYERDDTDTSVEIGYLLIGQGGRTDEPNTVSIPSIMTATDRNGVTMGVMGGNYSISGGDYTQEQIEYVKTYILGVYSVIDYALKGQYYTLDRQCNLTEKTEFIGTTEEEKQIETIDAVFNIDACVRLCILDEVVKNFDAGTYNVYVDLSPEGDGRLTLGPPWDFDFSMGNAGAYASTHSATGFYATNFTYSDGMRVNTTYVLFCSLPWFEEMVKQEWQEHVDELYAVANNVRVMTAMYGEQYQRDYEYWNRSLMGHHCTDCQTKFVLHSVASEFLADWLYTRISWLDSKWGVNADDSDNSITFDFTDYDVVTHQLSGFRDCYGTLTNDSGFVLNTYEAYDPYFSIDVENIGIQAYAHEFPYIEIEYMMPTDNSLSGYSMEIFLCAGETPQATAGRSVMFNLGSPDGEWHTIRINIYESPYWSGLIHSLRIDYFAGCERGDVLCIKSIKLVSE